MPDDPIFTPPAAAPATPSPSQPDVAKLIDERLAPVVQTVTAMTQTFKELREAASQPPAQTPKPANPDEWQEKFFQDTRGAIDQRVVELTQPVVAQSAEALGGLILEQERARIDDKYGSGAWDQFVWSELKPTWDKILRDDPARLTNRTAIGNAVNTIVGAKADELFEARAKHQTARAEQSTKQEAELVEKLTGRIAPGLTGGFRRSGQQEAKLSEEHRENIEAIIRDTGESFTAQDEKRLATLMNSRGPSGTTYAQWKAASQRAEGGR